MEEIQTMQWVKKDKRTNKDLKITYSPQTTGGSATKD